MRIRWLIGLGVIAAAGAIVVWWFDRPKPVRYVTEAATMGNISRYIIATGSVNPVVTVQVGSYVSGPIQSIYCDYNTKVKAGQLCAKIDPKSFEVTLNQAKANLSIAKAQLIKDEAALAYAKSNYERDARLVGQGVVSQETIDSEKSAFDQASAQLKLDRATILQRQAALDAARVNLDYTNIVSPVDGTVVSRNVNVGQTVAASFQTPTLFLIAQDLTKMQVDTNVSESDIGGVNAGQKAYFTVEAFPGKTFYGKVSQVRKAPITVQNVVTYDAVISVDNPELMLLPGMTANTRIITEERRDVLRVSLPALRFSPSGRAAVRGAYPAASKEKKMRVWILEAGKPVPVKVTVGLEDENFAEITGGELKAGDPVIISEVTGAGPTGAGGRRGRPPFRF